MDPSDKLTIETPEQISLEFPLAGIGSRFLALAFDTLLQGVVGIVFFILAAILIPGFSAVSPQSGIWVVAALVLIAFLLYWGYFAFFEAVWKGQTPGKRQAHIRVIKESGRPITPFEAISRNLLRVVDLLPGMYAVGVVSMLLSKQSKRLGDYVAGTVVVHEAQLEQEKPAWEGERERPAPAGAYDTSRLTIRDLELMETFLQRRLDLDLDVRHQTGARIAQHIAGKLGAQPAAGQNAEDFLRDVVREMRTSGRYH